MRIWWWLVPIVLFWFLSILLVFIWELGDIRYGIHQLRSPITKPRPVTPYEPDPLLETMMHAVH